MAKRKAADQPQGDEVKVSNGPGGPAEVGPRKQLTAEGEKAGTPVEELPQDRREAVGKMLADGKTFTEAIEATEPPSAEVAKEDKADESK